MDPASPAPSQESVAAREQPSSGSSSSRACSTSHDRAEARALPACRPGRGFLPAPAADQYRADQVCRKMESTSSNSAPEHSSSSNRACCTSACRRQRSEPGSSCSTTGRQSSLRNWRCNWCRSVCSACCNWCGNQAGTEANNRASGGRGEPSQASRASGSNCQPAEAAWACSRWARALRTSCSPDEKARQTRQA